MYTYDGQMIIENPQEIFEKYNVSRSDMIFYTALINSGKIEEAMDAFVEKYMSDPIELYNVAIQRYYMAYDQGEVSAPDHNNILKSVPLLTFALITVLTDNFSLFTEQAYAPMIFEENLIKKLKVKRAILNECLSQFESIISQSMAQTQTNVLAQIRRMQRELISFNQSISSRRITGDLLRSEINEFKKRLRQSMPEYYKAMEEGKILRTTRGGKIVHYRLEPYIENTVETTILNVDRVSVETSSRIHGDRVVEYYKRFNKPLKSGVEREICKQILRAKTFGKSLLALDQQAANKLGIMTVDQAKGTPDYAMGSHCRHSIKRANRRTRTRVNAELRNVQEAVSA